MLWSVVLLLVVGSRWVVGINPHYFYYSTLNIATTRVIRTRSPIQGQLVFPKQGNFRSIWTICGTSNSSRTLGFRMSHACHHPLREYGRTDNWPVSTEYQYRRWRLVYIHSMYNKYWYLGYEYKFTFLGEHETWDMSNMHRTQSTSGLLMNNE